MESQQGSISRVDSETRSGRSIRPRQNNVINYDDYVTQDILDLQKEAGWGDNNPFRFNWNSPIIVSQHHPGTVYFGGNFMFKTMNKGDTWEIISPDLTTQDPVKINRQTGGITLDMTGAENHCSIVTIAESPLTPNLLWAGTDDGNVQVTQDGGGTWTNVRANFQGVPDGIWVSRVEASSFHEGTCYVTFDGHRSDNFVPWVFKTSDFGKTWTNISNNLHEGQVTYVIREDSINRNLLLVGTEFGLFVSLNGGKKWERFMNNLPTVAVHDLMIHPLYKDVIIGTHGRGIWICDDISALQQMTEDAVSSPTHLFDSRTATQWTSFSRGGSRGQFLFSGENPPRGALVHYNLGTNVKDAILEITDMSGEMKLTVKLEGNPGLNRYVWNYSFNPPELNETEKKLFEQYLKVTDRSERRNISTKLAESLEGRGMRLGGINRRTNELNSVRAEAGVYKVTLTAGGTTTVKSLTVRMDPMLK